MNKKLLALTLIAAPGLMAQEAPDTNQTQETGSCNTCCCKPCCVPTPKKCIDCECYTPQFYDLQCDCGFFVEGEFLYWYARETNLSYALKVQSKLSTDVENSFASIFGQEFPVLTQVFAPQTYEHLSTKWDPGFRVGVGFNSECDGWDYRLNWTYFHNKKSNSISVSPDYIAATENSTSSSNPFFADNQEFLLLNPWINTSFQGIGGGWIGQWSFYLSQILNTGEPYRATNILSFDKINAKWSLSFNSIDLELGRKYWLSKCFNLRPYAGLRGAWTKTTFHTRSLRSTPTSDYLPFATDVTIDVNFKDRFKTHNWGAGILGGIQPTWYFCNNFALYSNLDMALLWGEFENTKRENYKTITTGLFGQDEPREPQTFIDPHYSNLSKSKFFQMNAIMDLAIGLRWEEYWCCEEYRSTVDIGWEHHIWFDHNHRNKTSGFMNGKYFTFPDGQAELITLNTFSEYDEVTGNLGYGGLVVRLRFEF